MAQQTIRVVVGERDKLGGGVQVGDYITINNQFGKVVSQELKQTWAYFRLDGDKKAHRRLPIGSEVNVTREVMSDEEKFHRRREDLIQSLAWTVHNILSNRLEHAVQAITTDWEEADSQQLMPISTSSIEELLVAQAERDIYQIVMRAWEYFSNTVESRKGVSYADYSIIEAIHYTVERVQEELLESDLSRGLSRSTSVMSNLYNDIRREQIVRFIKEHRRVLKYSIYTNNQEG